MTWLKRFNMATKCRDLKALRSLCDTDEQFKQVGKHIMADLNAKERDIVNQPKMSHRTGTSRTSYTADDYTNTDLAAPNEGYLDMGQAPLAPQEARGDFLPAIGDEVLFTAPHHFYSGQKGIVVEIRADHRCLVEITTKPPIRSKGKKPTEAPKGYVRTIARYLKKVGGPHGAL